MPKQNKRQYGVKIKNPLRLPVVARVRSETGAIRMGAVDGKECTRTIAPNDEVFISTKGSCELDIDFRIIRYDEVGNTVTLGSADFRCIDHRDSKGSTPKKAAVGVPVEFTSTVDVQAGRVRVPVCSWQVNPKKEGRLDTVAIHIQPMEPGASGKAWVIIKDSVGDKRIDLTPSKLIRSTNLVYKKEVEVPPGHKVVILASSTGGITRFTGVITGEEWPAIAKAPDRVTEQKTHKPVQEEEVKIRSLGDMLKELAEEEVAV